MKRKLSDAEEDAIAKKLAARRRLTLKELCRSHGVDKMTLYRAARRANKRRVTSLA